MAVKTSTGEVFVCDATAGVNKVFKISPQGQVTPVAGNGASTKSTDGFSAGPATNIPLLQPRAVNFDGSSNMIVDDTSHARGIRVDGGGSASSVNQFAVSAQSV